MINAIVSTIIKFVLYILRFILNIIMLPITALVQLLFPNVDDYIYTFYTLLNNYLINGIAFTREVIYNITGLNRELVGIIATIPLTYLTFSLANASVRFLVSIYRIYRTGKDE